MSRVDHENPGGENPNPATKFIDWKSNDKCFGFYNGEENEKIELPFKFIFLQHYHTVRGWHDASDSRIFANEVFFIGTQELTMRSFGGGELASGLYKNIKADVIAKGGKYHRSIYIMLEDGSLANIGLKGSAIKEYSDFFEKNKKAFETNWVTVTGAEDHKKGSIKYTTPIFEIGAKISGKDDGLANAAAGLVQEYFNGKFTKPEELPTHAGDEFLENGEDADVDF